MSDLIWLIPLVPLMGFVLNGLLGGRMPRGLTALLGCGVVLLSFVLSVLAYREVAAARAAGAAGELYLPLFDWFSVGDWRVGLSFLLDPLSAMMLLIITGVGFLIHVYSWAYMAKDAGFGRFFAYLNLFIFFMTLLVLGSNYLVLFIGWEGVGLCSYLLIGFWFKKDAYASAAKKAFVMNRIGDLGFLIAMFFILDAFGTLEYAGVFEAAAAMPMGSSLLVVITLLLLLAATGKSAQIPLFTWLPDAMAGPTPVSALIHAATMVTAGVYLVLRSNILFVLSPVTMEIMAVLGLATALLGAFVAVSQTDIKKVLAYSTVSQLGYMFLALGVGAFTGAFFHVLTHAFFKALLFLGAGSVIHAMGDEQDMRQMGGLRKALPLTFATMLVGTLAISGIPPFSGFFSKDEILAHAFAEQPLWWVLGFLTALLTAFYMFRLLFLTFYGKFRGTEDRWRHLHESPWQMTVPLLVLALLSALGGLLNLPEVLGGDMGLATFLSPVFAYSAEHMQVLALSHQMEYVLMALSAAGALLMAFVAYGRYVKKGMMPTGGTEASKGLHRLSYGKLYVDEFYTLLVLRPLKALSRGLYRYVDRVLIDGFVNGIGEFFVRAGGWIRQLQSGHLGFYMLMMVIGVAVILLYAVLSF